MEIAQSGAIFFAVIKFFPKIFQARPVSIFDPHLICMLAPNAPLRLHTKRTPQARHNIYRPIDRTLGDS